MGACDFRTTATGVTLEQAFAAARDNALYECGHGGYSGTVAEKNQVIEIPVPVEWRGKERAFVNHLFDVDDERILGKWDPASAVRVNEKTWIIFGYASE